MYITGFDFILQQTYCKFTAVVFWCLSCYTMKRLHYTNVVFIFSVQYKRTHLLGAIFLSNIEPVSALDQVELAKCKCLNRSWTCHARTIKEPHTCSIGFALQCGIILFAKLLLSKILRISSLISSRDASYKQFIRTSPLQPKKETQSKQTSNLC